MRPGGPRPTQELTSLVEIGGAPQITTIYFKYLVASLNDGIQAMGFTTCLILQFCVPVAS